MSPFFKTSGLFRSLAIGSAVVAGISSAAHAAPLFIYDFGSSSANFTTAVTHEELNGTPTLDQTGGSIDEDGATGNAFVDAGGTSHAAGVGLAFDSGINDAPANTVTLTFDTTGFENFVLRFDERSTATGSPSAAVEYRVGTSGGFTSIGTDTFATTSTFQTVSNDLSAISAIENVGTVQVRYTFAAGSSTGTAIVDNLQLTGTAVPLPEPATLGTAMAGSALALMTRRRRSSR